MKYIRPLTMAATLVLLLSDHASAQVAVAPPPYTLMVWGKATVAAPPDSATIDIDITARRGAAQEASADNARQTAALIEAVKASLGGAGTITTASYSVRPEYRYPREGSSPQVAGYVATNMIRVVTSMLDRTGSLIDAAVASGERFADSSSRSRTNTQCTQKHSGRRHDGQERKPTRWPQPSA